MAMEGLELYVAKQLKMLKKCKFTFKASFFF